MSRCVITKHAYLTIWIRIQLWEQQVNLCYFHVLDLKVCLYVLRPWLGSLSAPSLHKIRSRWVAIQVSVGSKKKYKLQRVHFFFFFWSKNYRGYIIVENKSKRANKVTKLKITTRQEQGGERRRQQIKKKTAQEQKIKKTRRKQEEIEQQIINLIKTKKNPFFSSAKLLFFLFCQNKFALILTWKRERD